MVRTQDSAGKGRVDISVYDSGCDCSAKGMEQKSEGRAVGSASPLFIGGKLLLQVVSQGRIVDERRDS